MIAIIDYGVGNLFSLCSSLKAIGAEAIVTSDIEKIREADRIILPGVGAFGDAIKKLNDTGLDKIVIEEAKKGKKLMGICLGMQLLFEKSYEFKESDGLGYIKGSVVKLRAGQTDKTYKIPHIGYNGIKKINTCPLLDGIDDGTCFYFVHSYMGQCTDKAQLVATTEYGEDVTAIVSSGNVYGTQFHPEKSGEAGLTLLKNFGKIL